VLAERNVTVFQLHRQLVSAGLPVNIKSLYRLTADAPLLKVDLRVAGAVCQVCGVGLGELITFQKPRLQLLRLEPKVQARLEELMDRNNDGLLNARERKEFDELANEAHRVSLENSRMLVAERRRGKRAGAKSRAVAGGAARFRQPIAV
jgi:hypothetical protein